LLKSLNFSAFSLQLFFNYVLKIKRGDPTFSSNKKERVRRVKLEEYLQLPSHPFPMRFLEDHQKREVNPLLENVD
jgi:hypothetical protein